MAIEVPVDEVAAVRAFNRFYTNVIGLVHGMYLDMPYPLTEARLLFELARREAAPGKESRASTAADLRRGLDIDPGYLSRVLSRFEADGLITRTRADDDGRRQEIRLTADGKAAAAELDERSARQIGTLLDGVDRGRLLSAMREISALLGDGDDHGGRDGRRAGGARAVVIRPPRPGDLGWVVHRHGAVYAAEFGWNADFERWVARIIADYMDNPDPARAAAWIAEVDGAPAGSVLCVPDDGHGDGDAGDEDHTGDTGESTARLRVLLVERWARGLGIGIGIGAQLVDEVLAFAGQAGYKRITLSTYDMLSSARRIYQAAGFTLLHEEPERAFGQDLTAQEWARDL